jgi:hypothetical protein
MKYTGGGVRDHILKMSNMNGKLAEMGMVLPAEFFIHLVFKSLPQESRREGALERREAPPPPPPRPSSWIRRTWCHRPTLDRIVHDTVVPEPALLPLRQATAAPATTTCEMASDSAPPSNPDGLRPCFTSVLLLAVLGVVDLDQKCVYLYILSIYPCRSTASGPVKINTFSLSPSMYTPLLVCRDLKSVKSPSFNGK